MRRIFLLLFFLLSPLIATEQMLTHPFYESVLSGRMGEIIKFGGLATSSGVLRLEYLADPVNISLNRETSKNSEKKLNQIESFNSEVTLIGVTQPENEAPQVVVLYFPSVTSFGQRADCTEGGPSICELSYQAGAGSALSGNLEHFPEVSEFSQLTYALKAEMGAKLGAGAKGNDLVPILKALAIKKLDAEVKAGVIKTDDLPGSEDVKVRYPTQVSLNFYTIAFEGVQPKITYLRTKSSLLESAAGEKDSKDEFSIEFVKTSSKNRDLIKLYNDLKNKKFGILYVRSL